MSERNKNFYSLEELKRAKDCYKGYQDGEEVYYFVGTLRYACDEIERLNNIINELEVFLKEGTELATGCGITKEYIYAYENALDKLKELKGSGKE